MKTSNPLKIAALAGRVGLLALAAFLCAPSGLRADQIKSSQAVPLDNVQSWVGLAVPGPTELAIFDSNFGTAPMTCGINGYVDLLGIVCSNNMGTNFLILAGGKMTNGASGIDMSAANKDFTIQAQPVALSASQTWDVNTGRTLKLQNCTFMFGANTLNLNSTAGGGTIIMPNSLNGTGPWTVGSGATVKLTNGGAPYPTNTTTVTAGGVFDLNGVNAAIAGTTLNLNGTGISGGGALASSAASFLNGPTVNLQTASSIGGTATLTINAGSPLTGNGSLTKVGANTVSIGSACNFNGGVNLNAGTLTLASSTALGAAVGTFTINGGTLGGNVTIVNNNPVIINGDFTNATGTLNLGTNTVTLGTAAGTTRTLTVNGTLTLGSLVDGTTATNMIKTGTAILNLNPTNSTFISGSTTVSNGTVNVGSINPGVPFTIPGNVVTRGTASKFQIGGGVNCTNIFSGNLIGDGIFPIFSQGLCVLGGDNSAFTGQFRVFRFAKLTNNKGVGGALYMDRTYNPAYLDLNGFSVTGVDAIFSNLEGQGSTRLARLRNNSLTPASFAGNILMTTSNSVGVDGAGDMLLSGAISGTNGLVKQGTGTLTLSGPNTYSGPTTVSAGTLLVQSSTGSSPVTVATNAALGGTGTIGGNVTFAVGAWARFTNGGTLTISGSLTASDNVVHLYLADNVPTNTYLLATYNSSGSSGSFASTPVIDSGSFAPDTTNYITTAGGLVSLVVESVATPPAPTNITYTVSGQELVLDWPAGQGWQLQAQTNNLGTGVSTNWFPVPGATSPCTNLLDPANPAVFYRLRYQ